MPDGSGQSGGFKLTPAWLSFALSAVTAVVLVSIIAGGKLGEVDRLGGDMKQMESRLTSQIAQVAGTIQAVQTQIASLPEIAATLKQLERRQDEADRRASNLELRLGTVERLAIELKVQIDNLTRSSAPAPGKSAREPP